MIRRFTVLAALVACAWHSSQAQEAAPVIKKVIVEYVTDVAVYRQVPASPVRKVTKDASSRSTPELALTTLFSAMADKDFDWWLSGWAEDSRSLMQERFRRDGRTPAQITSQWTGLLSARPVSVLGKAMFERDGRQYALVRYKLATPGGIETTDVAAARSSTAKVDGFESTMSFRNLNGQWMAVQELAGDPVFGNSNLLWENTGAEIRIQRRGTGPAALGR